MKRGLLFGPGLILVPVLVCLTLVAQATPPVQESPPRRPFYESPEALPFLDSGFSPSEPQENIVTAGVTDWSKIVFQSYRHGNWEIYLADGDGSNQTRLTNHSASDIYPHLNRGCTRIVFASNRHGNFEIYTMNLDGSGLSRLTSNGANDYNPSWSPDGARIVFSSYRDGQSEIYLMNADGSLQTRLTWNSDYDGQPAWSPDGTKIAFVSRRTGGYRVWVMNSDSSGQTQLSTQSYSANPAWSLDGGQIAYDSDGDADGWQELWLMNADGTDRREVYDPGGQNDVWVRSWSPDGQWVAFTQIAWIYYQGNWYWTDARLYAWSVQHHNHMTFTSADATDWYPDWQTCDIWPPRSAVDVVPPYTRGDLTIRWSGSDRGGSGLRAYEVQYRDGTSGTWTDWQTDTPNTSAAFSGTVGHTYHFRSRARDNAYNVEDWPVGSGDTHTTFYTWGVTGTVRDNRGTPVMEAMVSTIPGPFATISSDGEGRYAAYVADSAGTYTVTWTKSGYGDLPSTNFAAHLDAHTNIVLPPVDNAVLDSGFESGSLGPGGWLVGGVITPVLAAEIKHTGSDAVRLGWLPETVVNVSNDSASHSPQLVTDDSGVVHVVWTDSAPGYGAVYYAHRKTDGTWTSSMNVSSETGSGDQMRLAVGRDGVVHVVWMDWLYPGIQVVYRQRRTDGSWSGTQVVSQEGYSPQIAVDDSGIVHVGWQAPPPGLGYHDIYYAQLYSDGTWSVPQNISNNSGGSGALQLLTDDSGTVHTTWVDRTSGNDEIYYARRTVDGTWSSVHNVSASSANSLSPQLAVEGNGVAHVAWVEKPSSSGDIYYARRETGGIWSSPHNISSNSGYSLFPQIVVNEVGVVYLVWEDPTAGPKDIYCLWRGSDGTWMDVQNISNTPTLSYDQTMVVDGNEGIHLMWTDILTLGSDIFYAAPRYVERVGDSLLAQVVTVPTAGGDPTLSFFYQLGGTSPTSGTWFDVQLDDGIVATTLLSTTTSVEDWMHSWADLTPWTGQTVTLTFATHQTAGQPRTWAYLDEVTIGSAYPDLWISIAGLPAELLPGNQVVYTIAYGNRGGAAVSDVRVTGTLPTEFSFVSASLPPLTTTPSLVWDVGDLPTKSGLSSIVVTATVTPMVAVFSSYTNTVSIGVVSPELETLNNSAQAVTWIGTKTHLPSVMRNHRGW